jgi:hypothetical protein
VTSRFGYLRTQFILLFLLSAALAACEKQSGQAVVLEKEHIDAAVDSGTPSNEENAETGSTRFQGEDEITVDSYVMKREVRGTARDPRALKNEQWLIKVRTISDNRTFNVSTD